MPLRLGKAGQKLESCLAKDVVGPALSGPPLLPPSIAMPLGTTVGGKKKAANTDSNERKH